MGYMCLFQFLVSSGYICLEVKLLGHMEGIPGSSGGKVSACNAGDLGSIPGSGRSPGEGNGNLLQIFLPGEFHGQRNLVGYSPWDHKESDMTERLHFTSWWFYS